MDPYLLSMMPQQLRELCRKLPEDILLSLEEIRIRKEQPVELIYGQVSRFLCREGTMTSYPAKGWKIPLLELEKMINLISQHSIYALEEELRRGYVTVTGGHRIGIVGKALIEKGEVKTIRDISGLNIRIAREKKGVALPLIPYLLEQQMVLNSLIISPPQCGKTTLLRDLARVLSYGNSYVSGKKVSIVDERSELAGCVGGVPQKDVGPRTDILDACPKAEGIMMLIRSMSPDIIIADEIGRPEDSLAIQEALNAGVAVITSVHGSSLTDINRRPTISRLIGQGVFQRYIFLGRSRGVGTIEKIYNEKFELLNGVAQPC
ncbi:stage III sporulation protein AA [Ammoniphilus sp. CFH 90114]|uniref:stage III sporulation protein AA n=1 Tax=Ammoniphilus sp. CFH 90114 TaxID=2493665 RepID=UPI00100EADBB|nr:stage III sporulation protein AA [Ammoniphilus sp. CFH 90114]RXT13775.1 stage III sporulation protein AA [Ammoniphilus sp. CFH 90114]